MCNDAVEVIRKQMSMSKKPICGICMGNQLLSKAAGAKIYKLKYGHRGHNQPVRMVGTDKCYITSQNHGYAVDASTLDKDWQELFVNMMTVVMRVFAIRRILGLPHSSTQRLALVRLILTLCLINL